MTDILKIKERWIARITAPSGDNTVSCADQLVPAPDVEGGYLFPDVDYTDKSRATWKTAVHYTRMQNELRLGGKERIANDAEWRAKLIGAFKYWLEKDFLSDNWWWNQIGTPKAMLNIAFRLEGYLDDDMIKKVEQIALRGSFKAHLILGMTN